MKKILIVGLVLSATTFANTIKKEGEGFGYRDRINVTLEMDGDKIKTVEIKHKDSPKVVDPIIEEFKTMIIEKGANVDEISGATYTSKGIKEAVQNALKSK
jgi:uncharacterized protein with FMN-binding domain